MELLFKRKQTPGKLSRVRFKLWSKIELTDDEKAIASRYRFDNAVLIDPLQPDLIYYTAMFSGAVFLVVFVLLTMYFDMGFSFLVALIAAGGFAYWYINEKRETILVSDLLHGRHFTCDSVIELARKEAWLATIVAFLRQVMESAKHWDGTERHTVDPLPKDEARQVIIKGL